MDYPLTEEQIKKIKECLSSSHVLIYGLLKENQREALNFLISHRFLIFISFAIPLSAGPFGIEFGWSIEDMHEAGVEFIYPTYEEALAEEQ